MTPEDVFYHQTQETEFHDTKSSNPRIRHSV